MDEVEAPGNVVAKLDDPSGAERQAIAESVERKQGRRPRAAMRREENGEEVGGLGSTHSDNDGWAAQMCDAFGSPSVDFVMSEISRVDTALRRKTEAATDEISLNAALAMIDGVRPQNEVEAMLASQMAVTHATAMDMLGRAQRSEPGKQFDSYGNMAVKLMRTFTAQTEALAKFRRGGEQTVRVEHVHVHSGGQAIVGNVNHPGGGGAISKDEDQSHVFGHAPGTALPRQVEAERTPMQGARRQRA